MKHLLIIISLLLLSSPVIGDNHKGETLYGWENPSGRDDMDEPRWIWKGFGEKGTHPKYTGEVKNGKPNGFGYLIFPKGHKYVGSWYNGEEVEGTFTHSQGMKFVGSWNKGRWWNGTQHHIDGTITDLWVNGKFIQQ